MLTWTPSLAVGVEEIDEQHKEWFRHADAFINGLATPTARDIDDLFSYLRRYSVMHFAVEEDYMQELSYPELRAHKAQHERFLQDLKRLTSEQQSRKLDHLRIGVWLGNWLTDHVSLTDLRLAEFIQSSRRNAVHPRSLGAMVR